METPSCSYSDCKEPVVGFYPAFDRIIKPEPYCAVHLARARQVMVLEGPHLINMAKRKHDLVTV